MNEQHEYESAPQLARVAQSRPQIIRYELAEDILLDQSEVHPVIDSAAAMVAVDDGTGVIRGDPAQPITVWWLAGPRYGFAAHGAARGCMGYAMLNPQTHRYEVMSLMRKVFPGVLESGQLLSLYRRDATSYLVDSGIDVEIDDKLAARNTWLRDGQFVAGDNVIAAFDEVYHLWYLQAGPWARP